MKHTGSVLPGFDADRVMSELERAGVQVTWSQADLLVRHAAAVLETNRRLNLTRITDPDDVLLLHIVDSLTYLSRVAALRGPIVDVGSGAGYPGVPLAIVTGQPVTLCESVGKKADFLTEVTGTLNLGVEVYAGRAEDLGAARRGGYGTVVARAVAGLPALIELSAPLLSLGGDLVALKGSPGVEESKAADVAAEACGLVLVASERYALPGGAADRTVYRYRKVAEPRIALPRRPGMAQRKPLGGS